MEPGLLNEVILQFGLMLGYAAVVSLLVNIGKLLKWVKDGTADKWVAGANLVGVLVLYVSRIVFPDFDPFKVDSILGEVALVGGYIFGFIGMLVESKITYFAAKGLPIIGASNSQGSQAVVILSSPTSGTVTKTTTTVIDK